MGCVPSSKISSLNDHDDHELKRETSSTIEREVPYKLDAVCRARPRVKKLFQKYQSKMLVIYEIPAENIILT